MSDRDFFNNFNQGNDDANKGFDFDKLEPENAPKSFPILGIAIGLAVGLAAILLIGKFVIPSKKKSEEQIPVVKAEEGAYRDMDVSKAEEETTSDSKGSNLYEDLSSTYDKTVEPIALEDAKPELTPVAPVVEKKTTVTKTEPKKSAPKKVAAKTSVKGYQIQIASLNTQEAADKAKNDFVAKYKSLLGDRQVKVIKALVSGVTKYRVRVTDITTKTEADKLRSELAAKGVSGAYIEVERK
jgi:cell division protein FtsN